MPSPERRPPSPPPSEYSSSAFERFRRAKDLIMLLSREAAVREGSEAVFRTVMNIAISCADLVPGAGEVASWGADLLKVIEEMRYRVRVREATETGGDISKVQREKYNLTPDVHWMVAVGTESLEILFLGFIPTHAIEGTIQLFYDIPRMFRAIKKIREILMREKYRREQARNAAPHFGI